MVMDVAIAAIELIIGSMIVFKTAEIIVNQAEKFIKSNRVPIPLVGLLLLPLITGLPNLFVSIGSVLRGFPELVYLNNVGNTIGNLTIALGLTALFGKQFIIKNVALVRRDAFFLIISTLVTVLLMADGFLSSLDGLVLILVFGFYIINLHREETKKVKPSEISVFKPSLFIFVALIVMFFGAVLIADGAKTLVDLTGLSKTFVGVILVGLALILPETSVMLLASKRGKLGLSFGNLVGDTLISVPFIVGLIAIFYPLAVDAVTIMLVLPIVSALVIFFGILMWADPFLFRIPGRFDIKKHEAIFLIVLYFIISAILYGF